MRKITFKVLATLVLAFMVKAGVFAQSPTLTAFPNQGCAPLQVTFTLANITNNPYRIEWHFGDNSPILHDTLPLALTQVHPYTNAGWYSNVHVDAFDANNNFIGNVYYNNSIQVNGPSFQIPDSVCIGDTVNFCMNGGPFNTVQWNFGDGQTSSQECVKHSYTALGWKTIIVSTTGGQCNQPITITKTIKVSTVASPQPNIWTNLNNSNNTTCPGVPIKFYTNTFNSYSWSFGDGTNAGIKEPIHSYTGPGQKNVTLTVTNGCGLSGTTSSTVNISTTPPPFPNGLNLNASANIACPNSTIHFNAPNEYNMYIWNYGDGSAPDTTYSNTNYSGHTYSNATGTFIATVNITGPCGNDTTLVKTIVISNNAPVILNNNNSLQSASPSCPNSSVWFNAPHGYSNYEWNFGDGSAPVLTSQNQTNHTYGNSITTYSVSVKISNSCGNDTILYGTTVISGSAPFPTGSMFQLEGGPNPSCPNSNAYFQAPAGYSLYEWDFGDNTPLITTTNNQYNHFYGANIANYTVSVKIVNGCGADTTLNSTIQVMTNVGFPQNDPEFNVNTGPNPACPGDMVGFNAPGGYMSYKWYFGDGDSVVSNHNNVGHVYDTTGQYAFMVKITNACGNDTILTGITNVSTSGTFANYMNIETETGSSSCPGDLMSFRLNTSNFASYVWTFSDGYTVTTTGENIQHAFDTLGTFTVTCTVVNGCGNSKTVSTTVQVINNSPISDELFISSVPNPACANDEVFFIIENGQPNTKYYWNFGDNSAADTTVGSGPSHIYTTNGTYNVTVTAENSCGITKTFTLNQVIGSGNAPTLIGDDGNRKWGSPGSDGNNATAGCVGDAIVFYFMGSAANNVWNFGDGNTGTATEQMLVYGGDGAFPVTIIKHVFATSGPKTISLTITNSCGLSTTDTMVINIGGNQAVSGELTTSPSPFTTCAPIDFLAFGGASYAWDFGDSTSLNTVSPTVSHTYSTPGVYVATVVITNGCGNTATYSKPVNVTGVGGPAVTLVSSTNPTCAGGNNGSAIVSAASGQEPYTYLWNDVNAQTTATASNLKAGLYYVTVTDNIGCSSAFAVAINDAAPIVLTGSSTASSCANATGSASVTVASGGTSPYSYLWSTGSTASTISNLSYGLYSVAITDLNGCQSSANINVSEANAPAVTLTAVSNVSCNGGNDGAISISVTGNGNTYLWSNGATTEDVDSLNAGTYSVQVTSSSGCNAVFNAAVAEAGALNVVTTATLAPTCGNFDGKATATVTGGTSPYTYLWAGANNQTTAMATGLPAGTYTVAVTDANGCPANGVISLSNSNSPAIASAITNISCNGLSDGAIDITVTGGTSPYLYTWNVGSQMNSQDVTSLSAGNYLVFVEDAQGCTSVRSYTLTAPLVLAVSATSTGATCNTNDGTAMSTVTGGTAPYTYLWTGGQTTQSATGVGVGSYTVTVTDNNGCTASGSASISTSTPTPSICLVTVDTGSINNEIYWDKTSYTNVDSFIVYREVSSNLYKRIGAVPYDSLSMFVDTTRSVGPANGDPNAGTYRYKLQLRDACGNYSAMSPYHNTIYVIDNGSGQFTWNEYEVESSILTIVNLYHLTCDTAYADAWFTVTSVAGTQTTAIDANFATNNLATNPVWRVKTDWSVSCEATRAPVSTSRSNKKHGFATTGVSNINSNYSMSVYPNPAQDNLVVELPLIEKDAQLKIVNMLGQNVYSERITVSSVRAVKHINTQNYPKGIYNIVLETSSKTIILKLVIN